MTDDISSFITEDNSSLIDRLHLFCESIPEGEKIRYSQFRDRCTEDGISLTEDAWYDILARSGAYTFFEGCDKDGIFWQAKSAVF